MKIKIKLDVVRCCLVGCGRPRYRRHRHGDGFYIRLRLRGCCVCPDD